MKQHANAYHQESIASPQTRKIGFVIFPDFEILDISGPYDVFSCVDRYSSIFKMPQRSAPFYQLEIFANEPGPVVSSSGIQLIAGHSYGENDNSIDTLIVAGGEGAQRACRDPELLAWLQTMSQHVRRTVSICTGAFLLAACGLLNGRRATTHWCRCQELAQCFPEVRVEPDRIFIRDGNIFTSGGVTAGIDLALDLVEQDHGREVASQIARFLLVFLRRPGGQSQFSAYLASETANHKDIRELQAWIVGNPGVDLSVEALADRVAMSPRNFARVFTKETGTTPAKFVESARLDAARCKLEQTTLPIDAVAERCGFGNEEHMRRTFQRRLQVSPQHYRLRFRSTASGRTTARDIVTNAAVLHVDSGAVN